MGLDEKDHDFPAGVFVESADHVAEGPPGLVQELNHPQHFVVVHVGPPSVASLDDVRSHCSASWLGAPGADANVVIIFPLAAADPRGVRTARTAQRSPFQ